MADFDALVDAIPTKPYYREESGVIYCGDCLEIMRGIPDEAVDLVYADPPFNAKGNIGVYHKGYKGFNDNLTEAEYEVFCNGWFEEARRISKRLVLTPGIVHISKYPSPIWVIVIHKPSSPSFSKFGGYNCWEPLLVFDKPTKRIPRDVVTFDSLNHLHKNIDHPCPDNPFMVKWIIDTWSNENDIILDPFGGSGTTLVAAKHLGRHFIGIDTVQKYCSISQQRLAQRELF